MEGSDSGEHGNAKYEAAKGDSASEKLSETPSSNKEIPKEALPQRLPSGKGTDAKKAGFVYLKDGGKQPKRTQGDFKEITLDFAGVEKRTVKGGKMADLRVQRDAVEENMIEVNMVLNEGPGSLADGGPKRRPTILSN